MTKKFDKFMAALTALCADHGVNLWPSGYDGIEVWDADEREYVFDFKDETKENEDGN